MVTRGGIFEYRVWRLYTGYRSFVWLNVGCANTTLHSSHSCHWAYLLYMPQQKKLYLICFDIVDDRIRTKAAKVLEGYGERIQKSVFACRLTDFQRKKLINTLSKIIDPEQDSVHVYKQCTRCLNNFEYIGISHIPERNDFKIL